MSQRRYERYKASGVEWVGEVPAHWEVWKLSHAVPVIGSGTTPKSDETSYYTDGDIPWLNTGDLNDGVLFECEKRVTTRALDEHSALKVFPADSVVIALYGATIGKLGLIKFSAAVNQACCVLHCAERLNERLLFYCLMAFRQQILSLAIGGGQPNISQEIVRSLRFAIPSAEEQQSIATFLDRETAKIDALVAEQERLIVLLTEKRQAVISHAVTKGLDPNVEMKDSGVEWLGEVPEHWDIMQMRRVEIGLEQGWSPQAEERIADADEWGVIKLSAVAKGSFRETENKAMPAGLEPDKRYEIIQGDLLLTRANTPALVGDVCVVGRCRPGLMLCDLVYRLKLDERLCLPRYVSYWLLCKIGRFQITRDARGSSLSMVKISQELIRSWLVAVPPLAEQRVTVTFLDHQTHLFETLIVEARRAVVLLQERRTALISAAVTGKIDVRERVPVELT